METHLSRLDEYYAAAEHCARTAGKIISEAFDKPKNLQLKSTDADLVTETDKQCEVLVVEELKRRFPEHKFIGEESVSSGETKEELGNEPTWMIDPIDGTTNFVHRFPFLCISIGFAVNKQIVLGIVFNPILDEFFSAIKGRGAKLNGQPIKVTDTQGLKQCLVATGTFYSTAFPGGALGVAVAGFPYDRSDKSLDFVLGNIRTVLTNCREIRRAGSAALDMCYVAKGVLDIYYERGVHCWDIAAGCIIIQEAGGIFADPFNFGVTLDVCSRKVIAGNPTVVPQLAKILTPPTFAL